MLDKEDPAPPGGGGGLSSSGVASPSSGFSFLFKLLELIPLSSPSETGLSSSSSASTVSPNSFLSRSVRSSRFGSSGGERLPITEDF